MQVRYTKEKTSNKNYNNSEKVWVTMMENLLLV